MTAAAAALSNSSSAPVAASSPLHPPQTSPAPATVPLVIATSQVAASPIEVHLTNRADAWYATASFWFGLVALLVSVGAFIRSVLQSKAQRRHSIQDDFWLRKVLLDAAILPAIEWHNQIEKDLPTEPELLPGFTEAFTASASELQVKLSLLKVLNDQLYTRQSTHIESTAETVFAYVQEASNLTMEERQREHALVLSNVRTRLLPFLQGIRDFQEKIK